MFKRNLIKYSTFAVECACMVALMCIILTMPAWCGDQDINKLNHRTTELERKVSGKDGNGGVQKQVTILHAKVKQLEEEVRKLKALIPN